MLHFQLPDSRIDPPKAQANPFVFADTGLPRLVNKWVSMGANIKRMRVKIAGGATMNAGPCARSLRLHLDDGRVTVRSNGTTKELN